jgi:nitroreductase
VSREQVEALIADAVWVPSGSNNQPWRFAVIQDRNKLKSYSDLSKKLWLEGLDQKPGMAQYEKFLRDPGTNIFYDASTLVVIYGNTSSPWYVHDCSMVAYNLALLAEVDKLGSCWIGFAHNVFDRDEVKHELDVPAEYKLAAPILLGHPAKNDVRAGVARKSFVTTFYSAAIK